MVMTLLIAAGDRDWLLLLAVAVLTAVALLALRRRTSSEKVSPQAYARAQMAKLERQRPVQNDVRELMAELDNLARHINAQVETKYRKLESVISDADQRIAELNSLLQAGSPAGDRPESSRGPMLDVTVGDGADGEGSASPADHSARRSDSSQREAVCQLAEAGESPVEIGKQLGMTTGEVELILALHRGVAVADSPPDASG